MRHLQRLAYLLTLQFIQTNFYLHKQYFMKKQLTLIMIAAVIVFTSSCKKIVSAFYKGDDFTLPAYTLNIPVIPIADSTKEYSSGSFTTEFNVDSAVRARSGGVFGINAVEYIRINRVVLTARNADAVNNLSAIKSIRVAITSDSKSSPVNMMVVNIPANAGNSYTDDTDGPNIVDYLHGREFYSTGYGTVRRPTTKTLTVDMVVTLRAR